MENATAIKNRNRAVAYCRISSQKKYMKGKRLRIEKLLKYAEEGKFDLLLVETIALLGRNTVKTLRVIEKLKSLGVGIFFEKESYHSLSPTHENIREIIRAIPKEEMEYFKEA